MRKQLFLVVLSALALFMTSCDKPLKALDASLFTCTPNPLDVKAGKVNAVVTGTFPTKYFTKKVTVTVTPVLTFNGKEVKGTPVLFQGEKVVGNNQVISYKAGGTYSVDASFTYEPDMIVSELWLDFSVSTGKKEYTIPRTKVADGIIATAELVGKVFNKGADIPNGAVIIPDKFQRVMKEMEEADIKFLIQQSELRKSETKSEDIVALTKKIKDAKEAGKLVSAFEVSGYASPDGSVELNTNLAEKRQKVASDFINKELKKVKAEVTVDSKFTAEDWDGFQKLMEESSIQDKEVILRVLSMYSDPEEREREIKNLAAAYKSIADEILPQLRRSRLKVTIDVIGKSDAEISSLATTDAAKLDVEELLYAATLTEDLAAKAAIYQKAIELYPQDIRGFNNLGASQYMQGDFASAVANIAKALEIAPANADANFNAGLCALAQGDLAKTQEYLGAAAGTKGNLMNALGTVDFIQGDYPKAIKSFNRTSTNNAALVQILSAEYDAAGQILEAVKKPDSKTLYLVAIIASRTNDRDAVYDALRKSVVDATYKTRAPKDLEFSKYFADENFKTIVK